MVKKKIRTAVFISGRGSNFKNLINFSKKKKSPIIIKLLITNNKNAKGITYAIQNKIYNKIYNFRYPMNAEKKILKVLKKNKIKLVCLAGFMKILSKSFIKKFKGKIINIHPSLLPRYKGLNTHERVLKNKEIFSGCTVHHVNYKLDAGLTILQKKIKVSKRETVKSLERKILKEEYKLYPKAISKILN